MPPATLPAPPPPDHLFGDWDGFRSRLAKEGITYTLNYTTETAGVVAGGLRRGATYADQKGLSIDMDWQTLAGVDGFKTHAIFVSRYGANVSRSFVGDTVIQAQEIYGAGFGQFAKLVWLYGEESLLNDRLKIYFGRFAHGADYAASPLYCSFMTLTICGHPRALTANQGFEDWPLSETGAEIKVRPFDRFYISAGAFQSQPFPTDAESYTQGGYNGFSWTFKGTTGVSVPVEFGYEPLIGSAQMPGHYKIGFNYDSTDYRDNFFDVNNMPLALTGLPGKRDGGRTLFWATADQQVYQNGPYSDDGLYLMAAYAHNDSNTTFFNNFIWAGLIDRGIVPGRPLDQLGFGFTYYDVSPRLTQTERLQADLGVPLAGGARGIQTHGMVYELNYQIHAYQGVLIQPELEYFDRPGGAGNVPNAFLVGLKTNVDF
ncbi:carbohydrate porin [Lichenifustis flavocetrariae]|uniref:Carbohydrate porin n=1 Tax=Lichenifustis flavocetrariae TaxID=2949735 RepID=A0AA42CNI2_9HYPH|nr:carbohydrate porin [Lichenifustis flavocetrariae]MCW6509437.1 carbohydrate porin [Lichenifustis flavocetrariae]